MLLQERHCYHRRKSLPELRVSRAIRVDRPEAHSPRSFGKVTTTPTAQAPLYFCVRARVRQMRARTWDEPHAHGRSALAASRATAQPCFPPHRCPGNAEEIITQCGAPAFDKRVTQDRLSFPPLQGAASEEHLRRTPGGKALPTEGLLEIRKACIWGNHSPTMWPDVSRAETRVDGDWVPVEQLLGACKAGEDAHGVDTAVAAEVGRKWVSVELVPAVRRRCDCSPDPRSPPGMPVGASSCRVD